MDPTEPRRPGTGMNRRKFLIAGAALVGSLVLVGPAMAKHNHGTTKHRPRVSFGLGLLNQTTT